MSPPAVAAPRPRRVCGVLVPSRLEHLAEVVERSRWMLDLAPDWDGQGSCGYAPETWEAAGALLLGGSVDYLERFGEVVPSPSFDNGPEGSIDIFWETTDREMLLNVPAQPDAPVRYYGRSGSGYEVKGTVSLADQHKWFPLLIEWLAE